MAQMIRFRSTALALALAAGASSAFAFDETVVNLSITAAEVEQAQKNWGKALIQISDDYQSGGRAKATETAKKALDSAYGYKFGTVLFKPTLTHGEQTFRTTYDGALSYFVGGNPAYPSDTGFALKGWKKYEYKNAAVFVNGNMALTTGHIILTDKDGKVTVVDKTWGFKKDDDGSMRIVLHHSSLPYQPAK
ncbi:hypothetical protein [Amphibiibacter pelophylacis]|uniref:Uncharacterized protein n=1 Tax=Amphibiibacter pelophylacis TaxID=1799477 RepID=A0ACC6P5M4_9BURK